MNEICPSLVGPTAIGWLTGAAVRASLKISMVVPLGSSNRKSFSRPGSETLVDAGPDAFARERLGERRQVVVRRDLKRDLGELAAPLPRCRMTLRSPSRLTNSTRSLSFASGTRPTTPV